MPISEYDRTLGEVARRLDEVFTRIESVTSDLPKTFVNKDLFEAYKELANANHDKLQIQIDQAEKRVADLEDDKKWLYRLIIGAVILAVLGVALGIGHAVQSSSKSLPQPQVVSTQ